MTEDLRHEHLKQVIENDMVAEFKLEPPEPLSAWSDAAVFSSVSEHWKTPQEIYSALDREFRFDLDPCPLHGSGGLDMDWSGRRVFCNPPYGPPISAWLSKHPAAMIAVYLLPSRTDTEWFHRYLPMASEIRFFRGRLAFGRTDGLRDRAPFPSMLMVFRK